MAQPVIEVRDLQTHFFTEEGVVRAVDGVNLDLQQGRVLAIVGESGCGKSVTAFSILQLISPPGRLVGGQVMYRRKDGDTVDLAALAHDSRQLKSIRGNDIAMIFQEPMLAFSPVYTIGNQISEVIRLHQGGSKKRALDQTIALLEHVGVSAPAKRVNQYPHEYSGGMRQRAMIAMALSCNPEVLIADEPTTALDVTIEAKILALLTELQREYHMSIIFITHDMAVVAEMADEVAVMYLGKVVERADVNTLFERPLHPYTVGLLNSIPGIVEDPSRHLNPIEGSVPNPYEVPVRMPVRAALQLSRVALLGGASRRDHQRLADGEVLVVRLIGGTWRR